MSDIDNLDTAPKGKPKKGGKLIFILLALLLVLGGGGGAAYFFLFSPGGMLSLDNVTVNVEGQGSQTRNSASLIKAELLAQSIMPMDEIIINIRDQQFQRVLKLKISLELSNPDDRASAEALRPILLDSFQSHLRSLRISEIEGSRVIYRMKEELLYRADIILNPIKVKNILFSEMLLL